jgi:TolB-like protein/DNA-binding winged helix-turn-helix (wHTH) protein
MPGIVSPEPEAFLGELKGHSPRVTYSFGPFHLDPAERRLFRDGRDLRLPPKVFETLVHLVERHGLLVEKDDLMKALWPGMFVEEVTLARHVSSVRKALGDTPGYDQSQYIETVSKRGYRFIAIVKELDRSASQSPGQGDIKSETVTRLKVRRWWTKRRAWVALFGLMVLLAGVGALWRFNASRNSATPIHSLAVLPLENLTGDPGQEYFADGMTDALITELAKTGTLRVISRTSAMHFKGTHLTTRQIADQLGVEAITEGSVTRSGNRVRITAQLIDTRQDRHLWAETYEGEMSDILTLQNRVADSIAQHVQTNLFHEGERKLKASTTVNAAAYEEFLQGRYYWAKYTGTGWQRALEHFEAAIAKDPNYAPAYVGLADSHMLLGAFGYVPMGQAMPPAIAALRKAMVLDPDLGEAHYSLGFAKTAYEYDWAGAEAEFQKGLALSPNYAIGRMWHSVLLSAMSRHAEAIAEMSRARALDPVSLIINTNLCRAYVFARQPEEAIRTCKQAIDLDPHFVRAYEWLSRAYKEQNRTEEAFQAAQMALEADNKHNLAEHRKLRHRRGEDRALLLEELRDGLDGFNRTSMGAFEIAAIYNDLNESGHALEYLTKAYDLREAPLYSLNVNYMWDPLRSDPRFHRLLLRMNLAR